MTAVSVSSTGVVFRPDFAPSTLAEVAAAADAAAIDELWLWEDCFLQGAIAQAAVALASTQSIVVCIGVMPAPLRSVVATAMEIATLGRMFPGRVKVGIGHGVQSWMQQAGVAVDSPLTLMREYAVALRDLLAGRQVSVGGRYVCLTDVTLQWVPTQPIPILIGGGGPKTLGLAGELADGVILDCQHTVPTVRDALAHVAAGRTKAIASSTFTTVMYLACAPGNDSKERLSTEVRKWEVADPEDFGVGGSVEDIQASSSAYRNAGITTLVYQPVGEYTEMTSLIHVVGALGS